MKILVLDDDAALGAELASFLALNGKEAVTATNLGEARAVLARGGLDLVLADLYLGEERGTALLAEEIGLPLIVVSGKGGIAEAVTAIRAGAYDFLEKPIETERLLGLIRNLEREIEAERGLDRLREGWLADRAAYGPGSPFRAALDQARKAASSPLSILLSGPSGSGKEVLARWIHYSSPRASGPFVAVNCAAVPPELAESLFFGSLRGAYTGSSGDKPGWFQAAAGGTLFLDEIGDFPLPIQAKLLRAAESGELQRLGSAKSEVVELRIVSATNRDLGALAAEGRFREDLYWRLAQVEIRVPPLAERPMDIAPLAAFFLDRLRGGALGEPPRFGPEALAWLERRPWPGNVRELRALVERAAWTFRGSVIGPAELEALAGTPAGGGDAPAGGFPAGGLPKAGAGGKAEPGLEALDLPLAEAKVAFERDYVRRLLAAEGGSVQRAAARLGMRPNNLSRKLRELDLSAPRRGESSERGDAPGEGGAAP